MSVYTVSTDKNILNLPKILEGIDVNTRNQYFATTLGWDAGPNNQGLYNVYIGYQSAFQSVNGSYNTIVGAYAGYSINDTSNIMMGYAAGQYFERGKNNILMGNNTGQYMNNCSNNIFIGHNNTVVTTPYAQIQNNIGIGNYENTGGFSNISLGMKTQNRSLDSIVIGNNSSNGSSNDFELKTRNSILIGNHIENYGSNVLIINNVHNSNYGTRYQGSNPPTMVNFSNEYMNINDRIISARMTDPTLSNQSRLTLVDDIIRIDTRNTLLELGDVINFRTKAAIASNDGPQLAIGEVIVLGGENGSFRIDSNTFLTSKSNINMSVLNGAFTFTACNGEFLVKTHTPSNSFYIGSNVQMNAFSDIILGSSNGNIIQQNAFNSFVLDTDATLSALSNIIFRTSNGYLLLENTSTSLRMDSNILMTSSNGYVLIQNSNNGLLFDKNATLVADHDVFITSTYSNVTVTSSNGYLLFQNSNNGLLFDKNTTLVADHDVFITSTYSNITMTSSNGSLLIQNSNNGLLFDENATLVADHDVFITSTFSNLTMTSSNGSVVIQNSNNGLLFDKNATLVTDNNLFLNSTYSNVTISSSNGFVRVQNSNNGLLLDSNTLLYASSNISLQSSNGQLALSNPTNNILMDSNLLISSANDITLRTPKNINFDATMSFRGNFTIQSSNSKLLLEDTAFIGSTSNVTISSQLGDMLLAASNGAIDIVAGGGDVRITPSNGVIELNASVCVRDKLSLSHCNCTDHHWDIFLDNRGTPLTSDLVLRSKNDTVISFTDDFSPEQLNFTGKHRCRYHTGKDVHVTSELVGKVVIATGNYMDLFQNKTITIDEAIPIVALCTQAKDPRAFGVISGWEEGGSPSRTYKIGHIQFAHTKDQADTRVVVNSHGEGGIWVCNVNGKLSNGDLITTSAIPGYGMRQTSMLVKSYTIAKITCDCTFDTHSPIYTCHEFTYRGSTYRAAFVGCVYKF